MRLPAILMLGLVLNVGAAEFLGEHLCGTWKEISFSPKPLHPDSKGAQPEPVPAEIPKDANEHVFTSKEWKVTSAGKASANDIGLGADGEEKRELFNMWKTTRNPDRSVKMEACAMKLSADFKSMTIIQNSGTLKLVKISSDDAEAKKMNELIHEKLKQKPAVKKQ